MDGEEPTQATQTVLDPRRENKQNSGFSDDDISDILCILYPTSKSSRQEVQRLALEGSPFIIGKDDADVVEPNYDLEDNAKNFDSNPSGHGNYAIILRLSSQIKNYAAGFTFGRNPARCDVVFANDPLKRVSNIHFRIYINEYNNILVEDQSTNGTFVDGRLLTSRAKVKDNTGEPPIHKWVLTSGAVIKIYLHQELHDLTFRVRIPRREDEYAEIFHTRVAEYFALHGLPTRNDPAPAPAPAPANGGPVDIFKTPGKPLVNPRGEVEGGEITQQARSPSKRKELPNTMRREWNGSGKYNRIGTIGKGAFAIVYKVTSKYDGMPYAAKELEKRRFIKNGVLDQKVENEMNIMKRVQHPNIVRYIENLDWDNRLLIIIMEYVSGGDLGKAIADHGPLSEDMVQAMSKQLLGALEYLHKNNITHRDVKPDNILISSLDPLEVKLTDFGLSKMVDTEQTFLRTFCGTLLYCAPEVYTEYAEYDDNGFRNRGQKMRRMPGQRYSHAVDIWSLGGVLFYSLTTSPPYPVKSGISYSELLHKIMTTRLNITPLQRYGVSERGIDFLSRMLQRRPENRATTVELDTHPWLGGDGSIIDASQSYDEITDGEDLVAYSQQQGWNEEEDRVSDSMGEESEKENNDTGGRHPSQPQRLFGEVGVSAIGSSGAIPDDILNLPVSMRETEILDSHEDEYDSGLSSTPAGTRTYRQTNRQMTVSIDQNQSSDQLQSLVENVASQSLGAHEKPGREPPAPLPYSMDFNASKRKPPPHDTSDEYDENTPPDKPVMKRLKSELNIEELSGDGMEEAKLLACMPQVRRLGSGRQIDGAVDKVIYWEQDRSTWHLNYPEMTQLQLDAFQQAARDRREMFGPGMTPLWELAMKYFPSTSASATHNAPSLLQTQVGLRRDDRRVTPTATPVEFPPTAIPVDEETLPDTLPPDPQIVVPVRKDSTANRAVGIIESQPHSCVGQISFPITDSLVSFGRHPDNTEVYKPQTEPKVPKFAFKIMLWKDGYDPAKVPHPWSRQSAGDEDSYAFWISTKATLGIRINGHSLPSDEPKNPGGPSRYWTQLHDGDDLTIWGNPNINNQTALIFRCFWGASSRPRENPDQPLELAPLEIAQKLDSACQKTERRMRDGAEKKRRRGDAEDDLLRRQQSIERERDNSRAFEARRQEAVELLQARMIQASRRASPASGLPTSNILASREQAL
ncbi:Protein kinase protein rad53 [Amphichorda felina]